MTLPFDSTMPIRVCPLSVVVFVSTAAWYTYRLQQQQQKERHLEAEQLLSSTSSSSSSSTVTLYVVFVLGGPGSGKGTQCTLLSQRLKNPSYIHFSAGDLLRTARQDCTNPYSSIINDKISVGQIVPSTVTCGLLQQAMKDAYMRTGITHFLIDGYPRNQENVDVWNDTIRSSMNNTNNNNDSNSKTNDDSIIPSASSSSSLLPSFNIDLKFVLYYECPEEVLIGRLLSRGQTSGRSDDRNLDVIRLRIQTYHQESYPIICLYQQSMIPNHQVITIRADQSMENVYRDTVSHFSPSCVKS
jgi:UMP-CMP kinase